MQIYRPGPRSHGSSPPNLSTPLCAASWASVASVLKARRRCAHVTGNDAGIVPRPAPDSLTQRRPRATKPHKGESHEEELPRPRYRIPWGVSWDRGAASRKCPIGAGVRTAAHGFDPLTDWVSSTAVRPSGEKGRGPTPRGFLAIAARKRGPVDSGPHFGRSRFGTVVAGVDPANGTGDGSAKIRLRGADGAGTDPRDKPVDDETHEPVGDEIHRPMDDEICGSVDDAKRSDRPNRELPIGQ